MSQIPRYTRFDSTLALLSEGYTFISRRCQRYQSDLFETRLMLQKAICMRGAEAAEVFYAPGRFTRRGALPKTALWLLQDNGSVAVLDGAAHRRRKQMFLALMTAQDSARLADNMAEQWRTRIGVWQTMDTVVLHDQVQEILCLAVCAWAGVPLSEEQAALRTREFGAMIEGAGAVGPRNWYGMLLRARTERWSRDLIQRIRAGQVVVTEGSAVYVIASHRDSDGTLLDPTVAAVELLNVLRPTVAVARFVTFAALALHQHPACRELLQAGDDAYLEAFVHEVRRFYPFFPVVAGRVLQPFDWRGYHFAPGTWVLLDLYGTNHDPRLWEQPDAFRPERFSGWPGNAFSLIPQGGGEYAINHRCPGEGSTIALMKRAVQLLTTAMDYAVPAQDLRISLARMLAIPNSRFVISNVRPIR